MPAGGRPVGYFASMRGWLNVLESVLPHFRESAPNFRHLELQVLPTPLTILVLAVPSYFGRRCEVDRCHNR